MSQRVLAAITLEPHGGGVAAVSRLVWRVFEEQWRDEARLLTLRDGDPASGRPPEVVARVSFGAKLAALQASGQCQWVFYSHLAVAQVQRFVPSAVRKPYGVFLHGIEIWRPLSADQRRVLEEASLLVANSRYTAERVAADHPWIGPIQVCPLALPESAQTGRIPASLREERDIPTVVIVGRLAAAEQYKGHDQLLESWPMVQQSIPRARLVVVGDGDDVERLRDKAKALGVDGAVTFAGFVSDEHLSAIYASASVFAMPSRGEGFGVVYLEAMQHGLPCVGSIHDAAGDVIEDGVTGFLVDQGDVPALADRLVRLLGDRSLRLGMGEAGRRRLSRENSFSVFRDRFLALVQQAFSDQSPAPALTVPAGSGGAQGRM